MVFNVFKATVSFLWPWNEKMDAESCREKDSQTKLQTNCCVPYTQSSPNSIKHVTLLLYLHLVFFPPLPLFVHCDSKVWKGGEQNSVCVCEGGEV